MPDSGDVGIQALRYAYLVTCSEPDATPFLTALPRSLQERIVLLSTANVVHAAEQHTRITTTFVIGGPSTFDEARRLLAQPGDRVTIVVGPDPWGPVHGKGYVRARLVASLVVPDVPIDVIELAAGGASGRVIRGIGRTAFSRWIRRREAALLADYLIWGPVARRASGIGRKARLPVVPLAVVRGLLSPMRAAITLSVVLPYVLATEARARRRSSTDEHPDEWT